MTGCNYRPHTVRAAAILTNAYVAGTVIPECDGMNQLVLYVDFTIGSLTDLDIKVEFSPDGTTYYQETASAVSGDTSTETAMVHTFAATGKYRIVIPLKDSNVKVSAIGNGTVTNSSCAITAVVGTV